VLGPITCAQGEGWAAAVHWICSQGEGWAAAVHWTCSQEEGWAAAVHRSLCFEIIFGYVTHSL
jgi:hypothetical protein